MTWEQPKTLGCEETARIVLIESLPYPVIIYDNDGQILARNTACQLDMPKLPLENGIAKCLPEICSRLLLEPCQTETHSALPRLIAQDVFLAADTKASGIESRKWCITRTTVSTEKPSYMLSFTLYVPAGAEQSFKNFYRAIFEVSLDAMIVSDAKGTIVDANPAVSKLLGYTPNEIVGKNLSMLMPENHARNHDAYLSSYAETGKAKIIGFGRELEAQHRTGRKVSIKLSLAEFNQNRQKYFVGILQDMTEHLRRLELEEFTYLLSHDFRAPLRGIHSICEWLVDDYQQKLDGKGARLLELMKKRVTNLEQLFESISKFARIGSESDGEAFVDLEECVKDALTMIDGRAEIKVDYQAGRVALLVHRARLLHVIANILENAIKHHGVGPPNIVVTSSHHDAVAQLHFHDNGIGIEPQYRERVFRPFQTLLPRDQGGGSGVGLAIVRRSMQGYGGNAKVTQTDSGTCITLEIPQWRYRSSKEEKQ
jgi:PAS domain S-box-containing protein